MKLSLRWARAALVLLVAALLGAACGGGDDDVAGSGDPGGSGSSTTAPSDGDGAEIDADTGKRLRTLGLQGPQHVDPATGVFPCEMEPLRWVYDSLIREKPDGTLVPGLAESWEAPDPATFVLHLREGVEFQDGTPFDAAAVKAHLERGKTHPQSTIADVLSPIEAIETPDDLTVVLNLSSPEVGTLPTVFTERAGMIPSPTALAAAGDTYGAAGGVGAGPYTYDSHNPSEDFHVTAWDGYWDAEHRYLAGIDLLGQADTFQIQRIVSGEVDYTAVKDVQLAEAEAGKAAGQVDYRHSPTTQYAEIYLNWEVEPFDDVRVRQALNHALDRELLAEALTEGSATVAWSPLPSDSWAHDFEVDEMYPFDPEKARELLAEAGYPDGVEFTAGMLESPYYTRYAQAVQDMVQESGFTVVLETVTNAEINNRLYQLKDLPVAITAFRGATDPGVTLDQKFSSTGRSNPAGTTVEGLDELIAEGAASVDRDDRADAYRQAEVLVMENALSVPIFHNGGVVAFVPELKGVEKGYTTCTFGNFLAQPVYFER